MKIGISRPSWEPADSDAIFRLAAEWGFDGVQIKPHQYDEVELNPELFRARYRQHAELARVGLIVYPGPDYRAWEDKLPAYIRFAAALDADQVCVCSDVRESELDASGLQGVADALNRIGSLARESGVAISLHNHADTIFESIDQLRRVFALLDPQLCGLTFDTAHAAKGGIADLAAALEAFKPYLNNIHLKDLTVDGRFCPIGTGTLDLAGVLGKLREIGYSEWLIVDEESAGIGVEEAFAASARFLKANGWLVD